MDFLWTDLSQEDAVEELVGFLLVFGDVGIGIHAKHLWVRSDGQGSHILQIILMLYEKCNKSFLKIAYLRFDKKCFAFC